MGCSYQEGYLCVHSSESLLMAPRNLRLVDNPSRRPRLGGLSGKESYTFVSLFSFEYQMMLIVEGVMNEVIKV